MPPPPVLKEENERLFFYITEMLPFVFTRWSSLVQQSPTPICSKNVVNKPRLWMRKKNTLP
jgi:hypothetical protein